MREPIPDALAAVIAEFEASDKDVPYWKACPDADEPWDTSCVWLSLRFARRCEEHKLDAVILSYREHEDAPSMQGDHATTGVMVGDVLYGVDWTARQFHDITDDDLPCPFVYEGAAYPPLTGVRFEPAEHRQIGDWHAMLAARRSPWEEDVPA